MTIPDSTVNNIRQQVTNRRVDVARELFERLNPTLDFRLIQGEYSNYMSVAVQQKFELFMQGWFANAEASW